MRTTERLMFRILLYLSLVLVFPEETNVATCFDLCLGTQNSDLGHVTLLGQTGLMELNKK
jgi:hypothetical protein